MNIYGCESEHNYKCEIFELVQGIGIGQSKEPMYEAYDFTLRMETHKQVNTCLSYPPSVPA